MLIQRYKETGGVYIRNQKFIKPRKDNRVQELADQTTHTHTHNSSKDQQDCQRNLTG